MTPAFVIPFVVYLLGTSFIGRFGNSGYPVAYTAVVVITAAITLGLLRGKRILRIEGNPLLGIVVGLAGILLWIWISELQLERAIFEYLPSFMRPGDRAGYNPFERLGTGWEAWSFIAVRLVGIAILVPIAEELFWRGFLLRWLIDPEWENVKLGEYSHSSCAIVTLMFTLAHPEWIAAAVYCLLLNGLLYWKKSLWLCIVAHATSNLALALYVMYAGAWWLW